MESSDPSSVRQTLQIHVKYSRTMKDLLKEIQRLLPPSGTPRWMLYPGPPRSQTCTMYKVIGKVELVPASQAGAGLSQPALRSHRNLEELWIGRGPLFRNGPVCPRRAGIAQNGPPDPDAVSRRIRIGAGRQISQGHLRGPGLQNKGGHRNGRGLRIMGKPSWSKPHQLLLRIV